MVDFADSARSTLGAEWELALVDRESLDLVPRAGEVLDAIAGSSIAGHVVGEMLTNTVEVVSGVHTQVRGVVDDLESIIRELRPVTDDLGLELMSAGTHPFALWHDQ
ncbi:glutamate-cysteine ligase family protein, partial [Brevibacterium sp.]